jgi:hypothetical protein
MSLTFKVQPQELMPVYNPVVIVATSSQQAQLNYQLVSSIYCRGSLVTKMKTPVNPDGYLVVDLHKHLENRISFDFNPNATGVSIATQSFATYSVTFADEFREKWSFADNAYTVVGGTAYAGFIGAIGGPQPNFTAGEDIFVTQTEPYTNASYNGVHNIISITYSASRWKIVTDALWGASTGTEPGYITYPNFQLTIISSTYSISTKYAFNGVLSFLDNINWNYDEWDANTTTLGKFFTNVPQRYELDVDSKMFLNLYQNSANEIRTIKVRTNNGTYSITNSYSSMTTAQQRFLQANLSPSYFYSQGWIDDLSFVNNKANVDIWVNNNSGLQTVATQSFVVTNKCSRYEKMQLVFLDKMGSFIPYTFNMVNKQTKSINKTDYQQFYGSYAPASQNWTYNTFDRGRKSLDTVVVDSYTLNSDWVSQNTSDYLMELFESPEVYLIKEDGTVIAINLTVQSVERKQVINDQIINYTLTFEMSNKNSSQRG